MFQHRKVFDQLAKLLHIYYFEDWYKIKLNDIKNVDPKAWEILNYYYNGSKIKALTMVYPEHNWKMWKFHSTPEGYWIDEKNKIAFLEDCAQELSIKAWYDWYKVDVEDIRKLGGSGFLKVFNNSLPKALATLLPQYSWKPWKFQSNSLEWWNSRENRKSFILDVQKELNIEKWEDWLKVDPYDVDELGGMGFIRFYNNSFWKGLKDIYPEYVWPVERESLMKSVPEKWKQLSNQRKFFDKLAKQFEIKTHEEWYNITSGSVREVNGGYEILRNYENNLGDALRAVYPEFPWKFWKFTQVRDEDWTDPKNIRTFLQDLFAYLELRSPNEWTDITEQHILKHGGQKLLKLNGELCKIFEKAFPEFEWKEWMFPLPPYYWDNISNIKSWFSWVSLKLNIQHQDEWYSVTKKQLIDLCGQRVIEKYGGILGLFSAMYPNTKWEKRRITPSKAHLILFNSLKEMIPQVSDFYLNYSHPSLSFNDSKKPMEFDIFIPSLDLAFEYQGAQHFKENGLFDQTTELSFQQKRDQDKVIKCKEAGITLIIVPFWWDFSKETLAATIKQHRPNLQIKVTFPDGTQDLSLEKIPKRVQQSLNKNIKRINKTREIPYEITKGNADVVAKCRGCGHVFSNRDELRIEVDGKFINERIFTSSFCVKQTCFEFNQLPNYQYPPFSGKIGVASLLRDEVEKQKLKLDGVEFVYK